MSRTKRRRSAYASRRRAGGFTLVEIMIVLAIVAILSAIALPSYQDSITRGWRRKASACLIEMAQAMERRYTASMAYNNPVALPVLACTADDGMPARYLFSFSAGPAATTYALQAVPQGAQAANDAGCGTLGVDQVGVRTVSGASPVDQCW